jgi:hypothetical protein
MGWRGLASRPLRIICGQVKRPKHLDPPEYLSESPPVPEPAEYQEEKKPLDPTRYGDWEKKGIAIDF